MTLKVNSKKILDIVASGTAQNYTDAYRQVHPTASDITARTNSHKLIKKPESQIYLQKHIDSAKSRVVQLISSEKENIALQASEAVLDRALGKSIQRIQTENKHLVMHIDTTDLSSVV
jgi:hypothetical protein